MTSSMYPAFVTVVAVLLSLSIGAWSREVTVGDNNWYNNNKPTVQQSIHVTDKLRQQLYNNQQQQQQEQEHLPSLFSGASTLNCELRIKSCVPLLIQQRVEDSTSFFNRTWNDFKRGFNDSRGNYWIGNELLHQLTKNGRYKLRFDLQSHATQGWFWAEYNPFIVFDESSQYEALADTYSGNACDAFKYHSKTKFLTHDKDRGGCAAVYAAGFWYNSCANCNPNAMHGKGAGFFWHALPGGHRLMTSRMWLLCR